VVANRMSIIEVSSRLADMVLSGHGATSDATALAVRVQRACREGGTYKKKYETHEERVLMRHLNLYRNKMLKANNETDRGYWRHHFKMQEEKVAKFRAGGLVSSHVPADPVELDLDGL
jgi:hypothetical protein